MDQEVCLIYFQVEPLIHVWVFQICCVNSLYRLTINHKNNCILVTHLSFHRASCCYRNESYMLCLLLLEINKSLDESSSQRWCIVRANLHLFHIGDNLKSEYHFRKSKAGREGPASPSWSPSANDLTAHLCIFSRWQELCILLNLVSTCFRSSYSLLAMLNFY